MTGQHEAATRAKVAPGGPDQLGTGADGVTTGRQRIAAVICVVMAVVMLVTAIIGLGKLGTIDLGLDFISVLVWLGAAWLLYQRGSGALAVLIAWLTAIGMIVELGGYQADRAAASTSGDYLLPDLLWLYMFGLVVVAVVVTAIARRPKQ